MTLVVRYESKKAPKAEIGKRLRFRPLPPIHLARRFDTATGPGAAPVAVAC